MHVVRLIIEEFSIEVEHDGLSGRPRVNFDDLLPVARDDARFALKIPNVAIIVCELMLDRFTPPPPSSPPILPPLSRRLDRPQMKPRCSVAADIC